MIISKPKPTKAKKAQKKIRVKSRRKMLEAQIEAVVKAIVFWRDGSACVLQQIDGGRCGGILNWGHFIPRNKSRWLKYDLATFCQCSAHNLIHDSKKTGGGDPIFGLWFVKTFGVKVLEYLSEVQREKQNNGKRSIDELECLLEKYKDLYCNRFTAPVGDLRAMIYAGYYGEFIKMALIKELEKGKKGK